MKVSLFLRSWELEVSHTKPRLFCSGIYISPGTYLYSFSSRCICFCLKIHSVHGYYQLWLFTFSSFVCILILFSKFFVFHFERCLFLFFTVLKYAKDHFAFWHSVIGILKIKKKQSQKTLEKATFKFQFSSEITRTILMIGNYVH